MGSCSLSVRFFGLVSRIILVLVAITMVIGGAYVLILQATSSPVRYRFAVSGVLVIALGLYLLWDEFFR